MTTSDQSAGPRGVHLAGSVPLENAEQVFRTANEILGGRLRRDSRRRDRRARQLDRVAGRGANAALPVRAGSNRQRVLAPAPFPAPRAHTRGGDPVREPGLCRRSQGVLGHVPALAAGRRIAGGDPVPGELTDSRRHGGLFCDAPRSSGDEPGYEARLLEELHEIVDTVPHDQLAIQLGMWPWSSGSGRGFSNGPPGG